MTVASLAFSAAPSSSALAETAVADVMHRWVITCPPETPLHAVAQKMASFRIHSVVLYGVGRGHRP
jgi:CBS domain-containing protein